MNKKNNAVEITPNTFGKLVQVYRKRRNWTQEKLAHEWGYTREYVSQIESGRRKLDRDEQVAKLAKILDIPAESLEAVGKGIPRDYSYTGAIEEADSILLQALIAPAETTVKLSWLVWYGNHDQSIERNLHTLIEKLEGGVENRRGKYLTSAMQVLAYAHEMMGKIAFDRLNFPVANEHFDEMLQLGEEIQNPDLIALALIHKGDMLRRKGRYQTSLKCLEMAEKSAEKGSIATEGIRWQTLARLYAEYQERKGFELAINKALEAAYNTTPNVDTTSNEFTTLRVLQEKGQGYTLLWQPSKAIEIYNEIDQTNPFMPVRDQGVFTILKAQAYGYSGELDEGIKYALEGLKLARSYHSTRHISRVQRMYERLKVSKLGQEPKLRTLQAALS